jgi:hypothetical protein
MGQCQEFFGQVFTHARFLLPCYWIFVFRIFSKSIGDIAELLIPVTTVRKLVAYVNKQQHLQLFVFCKSLKSTINKTWRSKALIFLVAGIADTGEFFGELSRKKVSIDEKATIKDGGQSVLRKILVRS